MSLKEQETRLAMLQECRMRLRGNTSIEGRLDAVEEVVREIVDASIKYAEENIAQSRGG